jgi:hypothetical protein
MLHTAWCAGVRNQKQFLIPLGLIGLAMEKIPHYLIELISVKLDLGDYSDKLLLCYSKNWPFY